MAAPQHSVAVFAAFYMDNQGVRTARARQAGACINQLAPRRAPLLRACCRLWFHSHSAGRMCPDFLPDALCSGLASLTARRYARRWPRRLCACVAGARRVVTPPLNGDHSVAVPVRASAAPPSQRFPGPLFVRNLPGNMLYYPVPVGWAPPAHPAPAVVPGFTQVRAQGAVPPAGADLPGPGPQAWVYVYFPDSHDGFPEGLYRAAIVARNP